MRRLYFAFFVASNAVWIFSSFLAVSLVLPWCSFYVGSGGLFIYYGQEYPGILYAEYPGLRFFPPNDRTVFANFGFDEIGGTIPFWSITAVAAAGWLLARRRRPTPDAGCCRQCGYDLTGNESGKCPECGEPDLRSAMCEM